MTLTFRLARPGDEHAVVRYVRGIAEAEGLLHKVVATAQDYARMMFGPEAVLRGVVVEHEGAPVGAALWHPTVGTYSGKLGIYIEDVFVEPEFRGKGIGRALFAELARHALANGFDRLTWSCKNDNLPAVGFYERLGAEPMTDFTNHRLIGAQLAAMATL